MAILRLLLSLLLVALGTTGGAFAISGYFDAPLPGKPSGSPPKAKSTPVVTLFQSRTRFVAGGDAAAAHQPVRAKPKTAARASQPPKKKHIANRPKALPAPPPQQQAAAIQWPWSGLFKN